MKLLMITLLTSLLPFAAQAAQPEVIESTKAQAKVARIVSVTSLVDKPNIQVNVVVEDLGGSTDVSPTQTVYLTLYRKGEMFSTDATFPITNAFGLLGAKRVAGGIYEITVQGWEDEQGLVKQTYRVDARRAITAIQALQCEDFDCEASENFSSTVTSVRK